MSTTSIQNTDDPTASKKCQGDGRSGSGAQLLEPAALWFSLPRGGRRRVWNTGYGRPWAAETGTIPVRWVWLSGWLQGGSVPLRADTDMALGEDLHPSAPGAAGDAE